MGQPIAVILCMGIIWASAYYFARCLRENKKREAYEQGWKDGYDLGHNIGWMDGARGGKLAGFPDDLYCEHPQGLN